MLRMGEKTPRHPRKIEQHERQPGVAPRFKLMVGRVWARVMDLFATTRASIWRHPNAVAAGVRGTAFFVRRRPNGDTYSVDNGAITLHAAQYPGPQRTGAPQPQPALRLQHSRSALRRRHR